MKRLFSFFTTSFGILSILLLALGCSEEEPAYPELKILNSLPSNIAFGDTLIIQFEAEPITQYRINILEGDKVLSSQFRPLYRDGNFFEAEVIFKDRYLSSGNYDLRLRAYNEGQFLSNFHSFRYTELPAEQTGFALLNDQSLVFLDVNGLKVREYNLNQSFDRLKISPRDSLIYLISLQDNGIEVRHLRDFSEVGFMPAPLGANQISFTDVLKVDDDFYLLQRNGYIQKIGEGTIQGSRFIGLSGQQYYARTATWFDEQLAVFSAFGDGSSAQLEVYSSNLLGQLYTYPLVGNSPRLAALNQDELAILIRKPGGGIWELNRYRKSDQSYTNLETFTDETLYDAAAIAPSDLVYSTASGLYRYSSMGGGNAQFIDPRSFDNFQISKTNGAFYLQNGNLVQRLLLNNNLQFAASSSKLLKDYEILYNK
ncbi:hypothetical protein [Croceimicrobium sp.]|uniref:hypothetical protein n=1 Tax=Croceimicrobium sp. TaxID=2828340 RepID=UPI003BABB7ED